MAGEHPELPLDVSFLENKFQEPSFPFPNPEYKASDPEGLQAFLLDQAGIDYHLSDRLHEYGLAVSAHFSAPKTISAGNPLEITLFPYIHAQKGKKPVSGRALLPELSRFAEVYPVLLFANYEIGFYPFYDHTKFLAIFREGKGRPLQEHPYKTELWLPPEFAGSVSIQLFIFAPDTPFPSYEEWAQYSAADWALLLSQHTSAEAIKHTCQVIKGKNGQR